MAETLSKVEALRKALAEAEEAEKAEAKAQANEKRVALEKKAKAMDAKTLRAYFVENELKKRPTRATAGGGAKKAEKIQCSCAIWWVNKEKEKIGKSGWNDVKQCGSNAIHKATNHLGEECMVCEKHHAELTIKHGSLHNGWYERSWHFPEEMLGSKTKKLWVKAIWELYPTYKPENSEELLKVAGV